MDLGELVISLKLRTDALEKGLNETQRKLRDQERAAREAAAGQRELQSAYTQTAAAGTVAFAAIAAAIMGGIKSFNEYTSVMKGFENQIRATGQSVSQAMETMSELSSDGLISESDTAAAIKNLVNYGFTVEKAKATIKALKDTAVDNRQAHYNLGEAVRVTTEGIRMENSVLSDAAGVQKNIAKMKEEYAKTLNKTADALTAAEKAEAIYQGVMAESVANTGRAAEYAAELGGQQAMLSAQTIMLSQSFGASMAPALSAVLALFQPLLVFVTDLIRDNPALTATLTSMAMALAALVAVIGGVIAAKLAWAAASRALGVALGSLILNPVILGLTALAGVLAFVISKKQEAKAETERLKQAEEDYQKVVENGIQKNEIAVYEEKIETLKKLKAEHEAVKNAIEAFNEETEKIRSGEIEIDIGRNRANEAFELADALKAADKNFKELGTSADKAAEQIETYTRAIKEANKATAAEVNELAKQTAMKNREVMTIQNLLKTYSTAKKGTSEWSDAQKELSEMFPQFSTAIGINEEAIRGLLIVKEQEVALAWASVQAKANEVLMEKRKELTIREAAIAALDAGVKWLYGMEKAEKSTKRAREEVERLKGEIASLASLSTMDPSQVAGIPVITTPKIKTPPAAKAYKNEALDDAYRLMEHRKRMNQLTLADELSTLEQIKAKHVKTAEERMQIAERIYDVTQQISDKTLEQSLKTLDRAKDRGLISVNDEIARLKEIKRLYADSAEEREELDDKIFEARKRKTEARKSYEANVLEQTNKLYKETLEDRLLREELSADQRYELQSKTLSKIIAENQSYLDRVLADDKYSATEKEEIQRRITSDIRANINERLQLEKDYYAQIKQENINSINDLSKGIQDALRSKYEAEKSAEESRIKGLLDANEAWKKDTTDIVKSAYDARLKAAQESADAEIAAINRVYGAKIKAIQDELAALEQAEKQKSRAELDADDELKASRLRSKIEYEHDDFNKIALQKELDKLLANQAKRHEQEKLSDKKDALRAEEQTLKEKIKEETDLIKQQLTNKKELLAMEREATLIHLNSIAEATKTSLNEEMDKAKEHYGNLLKAKALQAQAEKLIVSNNQKEIIKLLDGFGEAYQITGQTLGEKLYEGFKDKVMQIVPMIDDINRRIDAARNAAVAALNAAPTTKSVGSANNPNSKTSGSNVTVTNNFNTPVTSPSDVSKAAQKTAQQLLI